MNLRTIGRLLFLLALPPCSAAARSPDDLAREITRPDAVRIEQKLVIKTPAFEAAAQELLEVARGAPDPSVVPALVEVLGSSSPGSKLVGADLARAIHPRNLVAVLAGLSEKGLPANADSVARMLVKRIADYSDPATAPALLAYLRARRARCPACDDIYNDRAFALLRDVFEMPPEAIELLWESIPEDFGRWQEAARALESYRGPRWIEFVEKGLQSNDPRRRSLAVSTAWASKEPRLRHGLAQSVADYLLHRNRPYDGSGDVKMLSNLARDEPVARAALLELYFSGGDDSDEAWSAIQELADEGAFRLAPEEWSRILEQMKTPDTSSSAFDLAGHFDIRPILPEVIAMLDDPETSLEAAGLLARRPPDEWVAAALREPDRHELEGTLLLLGTLRDHYQEQSWGRQLLPFLDAAEPRLRQAAIRLLAKSSDPEVLSRLAKLPNETLEKNADPYQAVTEGLKIHWELPSGRVRQGDALTARVTLENAGVMPIRLPLKLPSHRARWQVSCEKGALGPLAPVPGSQNGPWLRRGGHATFALDLGRVIRALGPGTHTLGLQYFSRSELRNWPVGGDFILESEKVQLEVQPPGPAWTRTDAALAAINSPDVKERERGWGELASAAAPSRAPNAKYAPLVRAARTGSLPRGLTLRIEVYGEEIHREIYTVRGTAFSWNWAEQGIAGSTELTPEKEERQQFFQALVDSRAFDRESLQVFADPLENHVQLELVFENGLKPSVTRSLSAFEAAHHPALSRWFESLQSWLERDRER